MALRKEVHTKKLYFGPDDALLGESEESEDWIAIKDTRNYGDTVHAQKSANVKRSVKSGSDDDDDTRLDFDIVGFNLALLERMIVEWSDSDDINEASIMELPNKIIQEVIIQITEGLNEEDEEEKKD